MNDIHKHNKMQLVTLSDTGREVRIYLNEEILQEHLKECSEMENHIHMVLDMEGNLKGMKELV